MTVLYTIGIGVSCIICIVGFFGMKEYRDRTLGVKKLTKEKYKQGYFQRPGYDENGKRIICRLG